MEPAPIKKPEPEKTAPAPPKYTVPGRLRLSSFFYVYVPGGGGTSPLFHPIFRKLTLKHKRVYLPLEMFYNIIDPPTHPYFLTTFHTFYPFMNQCASMFLFLCCRSFCCSKSVFSDGSLFKKDGCTFTLVSL